MESGYFGGKRSLVFAPKKNPASDKLKPEGKIMKLGLKGILTAQ